MLVDELLLTMVLEDDGVAVESAEDPGQTLAADQVHVNRAGLLPELIEKRILDVDGATRRLVHRLPLSAL